MGSECDQNILHAANNSQGNNELLYFQNTLKTIQSYCVLTYANNSMILISWSGR